MELNNFIKAMNWRYATKVFDPSRKVSAEDLNMILEAGRLSASSFGIQPWRYVVVSDPELRIKLKQYSWNQPQITDCSHLIVIVVKTSIDTEYVENYIDHLAQERGIERSALAPYRDMIIGFLPSVQGEAGVNWMAKQGYLALGTILAACAVAQVDACPMEGFDPKAYNQLLGLDEDAYTTSVLCAIGYRSSGDGYSKAKKVRPTLEEMVIARR